MKKLILSILVMCTAIQVPVYAALGQAKSAKASGRSLVKPLIMGGLAALTLACVAASNELKSQVSKQEVERRKNARSSRSAHIPGDSDMRTYRKYFQVIQRPADPANPEVENKRKRAQEWLDEFESE